MNDKEKVKLLREALSCLLDEYRQYADNACHCEEYADEEDEAICPYCYAQDILGQIK